MKSATNKSIFRALITAFCFLLTCPNILFAQSDTIKWNNYLFIKTRLPARYVYEYQDTLGNVIIPQGKYGHLEAPDDYGFINAWIKSSDNDIENNVGFIDIHENILIPYHYSRVFSFSHNLACATKNGKTGYIDRKGKTVIPFLYDSRKNFKAGVVVLKKGNKNVLIDTLGKEIINESNPYQEINENFPHDQFLWIKKDGKFAFFNSHGIPLTPFIFDKLHPANVSAYQPGSWYVNDLRWFYKGFTVVEKDNQYAVVNENMSYAIPWEAYQWISPLSVGGIMIVKQNNKFGLLNHELELVQPIEFDTISNYPANDHEQNFPTFWARKNEKYYILDTLGCWKDSTEYDNIELLKANFYLATEDRSKHRLDRYGNRVIEDFTIVSNDEHGYVACKDSLFGLVDRAGNIILPFEFDAIISESLGNIFVKKNGSWGMVDEENNKLLPYIYDYIAYAWDDSNDKPNYIVVQNNKFGKVSESGVEIFPCMYDGITTWVEYGPVGHYVMVEGKMGLINDSGKVIVPAQYDKVSWIYGTDWAVVYDEGKIGLYDIKVKSFLLSVEYDYLEVDKDFFEFQKDKPTRIITYKGGIVNILDEKGKMVRSNVPKTEIKKEFEIDIDAYQYSPCSYELLCMTHNRTYQAPDCLINSFKRYNHSADVIYYQMGESE